MEVETASLFLSFFFVWGCCLGTHLLWNISGDWRKEQHYQINLRAISDPSNHFFLNSECSSCVVCSSHRNHAAKLGLMARLPQCPCIMQNPVAAGVTHPPCWMLSLLLTRSPCPHPAGLAEFPANGISKCVKCATLISPASHWLFSQYCCDPFRTTLLFELL